MFGSQALPSLAVEPGGLARVLEGGSAVLTVGSLDLAPVTPQMSGGIPDLADKDLVVCGGNLAAVTGWVRWGE